MGNASRKDAEKMHFLSKDELSLVRNSFKVLSKNSDKIREEDLSKIWGAQMDSRLVTFTLNFLFYGPENEAPGSLARFAELYVFTTRGTCDERIKLLLCSLRKNDIKELTYKLIKDYVESLVATYMKMIKNLRSKEILTWMSKGSFISPQNIPRLAESLTVELSLIKEGLNERALEDWLRCSTLLSLITNAQFKNLYRLSQKEKPSGSPADHSGGGGGSRISRGQSKSSNSKTSSMYTVFEDDDHVIRRNVQERSLIPAAKGMDHIPSYPSILDLNQIVYLNTQLPQEFQQEWRFLFSSMIHGESFSTLLGRIVDQGRTLIVVEDHAGNIFGGFASANWQLRPKFYGEDSSFLFTLAPKMRIFHATGYNQNFQYLNVHQQSLPNGLAMGGQFNYCGLWLDSEYGTGHTSETCTTYANYKMMSTSKNFTFSHLEVWGLGDRPRNTIDSRRPRKSVLDEKETRAFLEMAGHQTHSAGLRDED